MSLIKKIKRFNGTTWDEFNIAESGSNLQNGEGLDSLIQIYSGEVDDTHFANTCTGESAAAFGEANTVGANRALSAGKLNIIQVTAANSITAGLQNSVIGAHGLTVGGYNDNRGIEAIMAGAHNYSVSVAGITAGHNNGNYSAYSLVVGTNNLTQNNDGIIVGGNWSKDTQGLLLALGNGTSDDDRSNAFEVLRNGSAVVGGLRYDYAKYKVYQNLSIILNETLYEGEYYINSETGAKYCTIGGVNLIDEALNNFITGEVYVGGALREITVIYNEDGSLNTLGLTNPDAGGVLVYATIENNAYKGRTPTSAEGQQSFAGGGSSHAYGDWSFAFGKDAISYGKASVAFNASTAGTQDNPNDYGFAFAANESTSALGRGSASFGLNTIARGQHSFAAGTGTNANASGSMAIGHLTNAFGILSLAAGLRSSTSGNYATAFGTDTNASGESSFTAGYATKAKEDYQVVIGQCNEDSKNALFIVGNGTSDTDRKNAFEVHKDGIVKVYGVPVEENDAVRLKELNTKFDKTGGIINGNVTIGGNLTVEGITYAVDIQNLRVEDNVIVANTTGMSFNNAGFAIMTGADTTYGIMYNSADDGVMIGSGTIGIDGEFTYDEGQAQYLATIDWNMGNGNIPVFNSVSRTLESSGLSVADLATKEELETKVTELEAKIAELETKLIQLLPRIVRL